MWMACSCRCSPSLLWAHPRKLPSLSLPSSDSALARRGRGQRSLQALLAQQAGLFGSGRHLEIQHGGGNKDGKDLHPPWLPQRRCGAVSCCTSQQRSNVCALNELRLLSPVTVSRSWEILHIDLLGEAAAAGVALCGATVKPNHSNT